MKKSLTLIGILILVVAFHMTVAIGISEAQNYANYDQSQTDEEFLTDEQIEQILVKEGVPLTRSTILGVTDTEEYTLGFEDIIKIDVRRHPEVSGKFALNKQGNIQYTFVGDINIAGMNKDEVAEVLTAELSKYIINPDLTVTITGYNSKIVYVIGEVGRPGKIFMRGDTITVREALVLASLPLLTAKAGNARLITPSLDGSPKNMRVDVHKLLFEGDLRENYIMNPGDTLYIPPTFMAKALRVIRPVAEPIGSAAGVGRTVTTGF